MLHEPLRAVGRQSTLLHAVQHGGVSCMGVTNPSLALSGHARQFRAETLCSAKRGKGKGVRGPLPNGPTKQQTCLRPPGIDDWAWTLVECNSVLRGSTPGKELR